MVAYGHWLSKERPRARFCLTPRDGNDAGCPRDHPSADAARGDGHHGRPARADPHPVDHARPSPQPSARTSHRFPVFPATDHRPRAASAYATTRTLNANGCDRTPAGLFAAAAVRAPASGFRLVLSQAIYTNEKSASALTPNGTVLRVVANHFSLRSLWPLSAGEKVNTGADGEARPRSYG